MKTKFSRTGPVPFCWTRRCFHHHQSCHNAEPAASAHDAHAELRLDPLVPVPDHVVIEHADEFVDAYIDFVKQWDWDWGKINPRAIYYSEAWGVFLCAEHR